jgi:hypothetical protein
MRVLADGVERGAIEVPADRLPRAVRTDVEAIAADPDFFGLPPTLVARAVNVWAQLYGAIGFELFGRFGDAFSDPDALFEHQIRVMARYLGLLGSGA